MLQHTGKRHKAVILLSGNIVICQGTLLCNVGSLALPLIAAILKSNGHHKEGLYVTKTAKEQCMQVGLNVKGFW